VSTCTRSRQPTALTSTGGLLRYVVRVKGSLNVNVQLVRVGAAAPYFYRGRRGRYAALLEPGQSGVYHAESNQEAFLVLAGECRLLVEGEERRLRAWDFFHSPPWTEHAFVGAGDGPCVILMVGAHLGPEVRYPVSELAARYGASVEKETSDPGEVYATAERFRRERPPYWSLLPWG
jgi:uncharacterized cupin superfamily protein